MGKIVLVLLGVLLMLVFILPSGMQGLAGSNPVVGTIDGDDVRVADIENAANIFDYARSEISIPSEQGQFIPLPDAAFGAMGGPYADLLDREPQLFYLLLQEARRQGLALPDEEVLNILLENDVHVMVQDPASPDGRTLRPLSEVPGEQIRQRVTSAAAAILDVQQNASRYLDLVKVSQPVLDYHLSIQQQEVALETVVVSADAFLPDIDPPSDEDQKAHFEAYKENLAGEVTEENPFGFGYRLPDRVKLQYITLPQSAVEERVAQELSELSLREREQRLYRYWNDNRARFPVPPGAPATNPAVYPAEDGDAAAEPTTQPTTAPADESEPSDQPPPDEAVEVDTTPIDSGPGALLLREGNDDVEQFLAGQTRRLAGNAGEDDWRRFVAVHDDVADRFFFEQTTELDGRVRKRLRELIARDYRTFDLARQQVSNTETPVSSVGVSVDDPTYLDQVADVVSDEFGVRLTTSSFGRDFLTGQELMDTEVVGPIAEARARQEEALAGRGQPLPFPAYAIGAALPLVGEAQREQLEQSGLALDLFQPSELLTDLAGNAYFFRLIDAADDSAPESIEAVADRVVQDLHRRQAYERALATAQEIAEAARRTSLAEAGQDWPHRSTEPFIPAFGAEDLAAFGLENADPAARGAGAQAVAQGVYKLLTQVADSDESLEDVVDVIEIRPAFVAVVASPTALEATWTDEMTLALRRAGMRSQLGQQTVRQSGLLDDFFDKERVERRVKWQARHDD